MNEWPRFTIELVVHVRWSCVLPGSHVLVEGVPLEPGEFALGTPEHPLALVDFFAVGHQVHIGLRDEIAEVTAPSVGGKIHKNLCYDVELYRSNQY